MEAETGRVAGQKRRGGEKPEEEGGKFLLWGEKDPGFLECVFQIFFVPRRVFPVWKGAFLSSSSSSGRYCCAGGGKKMRCYSSASFPLPHLELIKF